MREREQERAKHTHGDISVHAQRERERESERMEERGLPAMGRACLFVSLLWVAMLSGKARSN